MRKGSRSYDTTSTHHMLRATTKSYDIVGSDEYYTDYWEINDERILPHIGYGSKDRGRAKPPQEKQLPEEAAITTDDARRCEAAGNGLVEKRADFPAL